MNMHKTKMSKRLMALILAVIMIISVVPMVSFAQDVTSLDKIVDPSTMNDWENFFGNNAPNGVNTENAGGVWGDKSVFATDTDFDSQTIRLSDSDNFLVALSAIASNKTIVGYSTMPTDTVLVLDLSNSMSSAALTNMITAANDAIEKLLDLNENNRVGVVVYAGTEEWAEVQSGNQGQGGRDDRWESYYTKESSSYVLLPIDRYTGVNSGGNTRFIQYDNGDYSVVNGVKNSAGATVSGSDEVGGATYIQAGLYTAWEMFDDIKDTTVTSGIQKGKERLPVLVLMSDGAPTVATSSYTEVGNHDSGTGGASSANNKNAFYTQLTASWVRGRMTEKYGDSLFYTLGLGVGDNDIAKSVLDPANTSIDDINTYWNTYLDTAYDAGTSITLRYGNSNFSVIKDAGVTTQDYVDSYYAASNAQGLIDAFGMVVNQIIIQSKYYPTLVSNNEHDLDGYITFNDELGDYMEVKAIKGILADGKLYSGYAIGKAVKSGIFGDLSDGDMSTLNTYGMEVLKAVEKRLGCTEQQAKDVLAAAIESGQISYTDDNNYSNYIGWYADASGNFLGFWDGKSTENAVNGAVYANRSYGFYGTVGSAEEFTLTDMLYISVQVHKEIATGHETVIYKIPASLVPLVEYEINFEGDSLDNAKNVTMTVSDAQPIRLVYETGLRSDINEINITEKVPATGEGAYKYIENGVYTFYTNMFGSESNIDPANHDTTWFSFNPSYDNERYYNTTDSYIYDDNGDIVTVDPRNTGENYYHKDAVFSLTGNGNEAEITYEYHRINELSLAKAKSSDTGWYIPKNVAHTQLDGDRISKTENKTGTLSYSNYLLVPNQGTSAVSAESYVANAYLGNNGKFSIIPAQGIAISKDCTYIPEAGTKFEFSITLTAPMGSTLSASYPITRVSATGVETTDTVSVDSGVITLSLENGETVYITGMETGTAFEITEDVLGKDYKVDSINGVANAAKFTGTVAQYVITDVDFVNEIRSEGNLIITKRVEHPFDDNVPSALYEKEFNVQVDLGATHADHTVTVNGVNTQIGADGTLNIKIKTDHSVIIGGIEDGTSYTITETDLPEGFTLSQETSKTYGLTGAIVVNENKTAQLTNVYAPDEVYPVNVKVEGTKELEGRDWLDSDLFEFQLQYFNGVTWEAVAVHSSDKVTVTADARNIIFTNAIKAISFNRTGVYQFRVVELRDEIGGVTYDHTERHFSITVTDDNVDGKYEISEVKITSPTAYEWIDADSTHSVSFVFNNKYAPLGNTAIQIDISKTLTDDAKTGKLPEGFKFGLYDGDTLIAESTETDQAGQALIRMVYAAMVLKDVNGNNLNEKTFTYTLKEIIPDTVADGMEYDETAYTVTVVVKDDLDGSVSATVQIGDSTAVPTNTANVSFTNKYVLDAVTDTAISGTKTLGNDPIKADSFKFILKDEEGKEIETVSCGTDGKFAFAPIEYTAVGTFRYTVSEVNTALTNVTYDTTVYDVTVVVSDGGEGKLGVSKRTITKSNDTVEAPIVFENTVDSTKAELTINVDKVIDNKTKETIESEAGFVFILTDRNGVELENKATNAAGKAVFTLKYTNDDAGKEYVYKVYERNDAVGGYTYSTVVYTYTVKVEYDSNYELVVSVDGTAKNTVDASFTNTYDLGNAEVTLGGKKEFDYELKKDVFSFALKAEDGTVIETVKNKADGTFSFTKLSYDKTGTYKYTISEVDAGNENITYDNDVYNVTVTVTVGADGNLVAKTAVTVNGNTENVDIVFDNKFTPKEATVEINIQKLIDNRTQENVKAKGFEFKLVDESGKTAGTAVSGDDGKAAIKLAYGKAAVGKTYTYKLSEVNTGIDGYEYSNKVYEYTVKITADGDYKLNAVVDGETNVEFTNVYKGVTPPPQTGNARLKYWVPVMLMSGGALIGLTFLGKEKEDRQKV